MPPQKNPYLRQYKEDVSSKQKLIRQRLGQPVESEENGLFSGQPRQSQNQQNSIKLLQTKFDDNGDFPSIDDDEEDNKTRGQSNTIDRMMLNDRSGTRKQNNEDTNFQRDAEKSLRFFKENLHPKSTSITTATTTSIKSAAITHHNQPNKTSTSLVPSSSTATLKTSPATTYDRRQPTAQKFSSGYQLDRQPSLGSIKTCENVYVARSRAPLDVSEQSRPPNNNNYNYKISSASMSKPAAAALRQQSLEKTPSTYKITETTLVPSTTPPSTTAVQRRTRGSTSSSTTQKHLLSSEAKANSKPAEEQIKRSHNRMTSPASRIPDSPIPAEAFARKPLYNSLLRAHDSIRLKVNRPKVRPKSESDKTLGSRVEDTELDDTIELADIRNDDHHHYRTSSVTPDLHERAIDVKRRSSRKKNKAKKEKKGGSQASAAEQGEEQLNELPARSLAEIRVVRVTRSENERYLGVTVRAEDGHIVVARILAGSLADKQGALQVGDIILAVNNRDVQDPEQLQEQLRRTINDDEVLLKIVPSFREELPTLCIYLRALFSYDPNEDSLLPCKEVGVSFDQGDILEVVNQEDPNWWQARRVDSENLQTGLIPSQELEERRRAFVIPDYDLATRTSICGTKVSRKSKKKEIYNVGQNCDFDRAELQLYEEVCRTPAFERRTLVLIGANGVGKQAFKVRLLNAEPERFGSPLPHTSRLPRDGEEDGVQYHFVTRERMEEDIIAGKYLEYGEYDGALYGTKLDSVREIIGSSRICILDCSPTCLKVLKTSDYLPFVAFIAAPTLDQLRYMHDWNRGSKTYATFDRALSRQSRRAKTLQDFAFDFFEDEDLQQSVEESARLFRIYENYFDIVLVNNDFNRTFEQLREAIDALSMEPQWIPISWIYGT